MDIETALRRLENDGYAVAARCLPSFFLQHSQGLLHQTFLVTQF
jgi:hypothetical protein